MRNNYSQGYQHEERQEQVVQYSSKGSAVQHSGNKQSSWYNEQTAEGEQSMFQGTSKQGGESFARKGAVKKNMEVTGKIGAPAPQMQQQQYGRAPQQGMGGQYGGLPQQQQQADYHHGHVGISVGSSRYANGSNQNVGNVITDRSSTRIHAPPGGHSSITFG